MNAEKFWTGWLKVSMIMIIMVGTGLIVIYNTGTSGFLDTLIDRAFFQEQGTDPSSSDMRSWLISIIGAVMIGWGFSMLYLVNHPFRKGESWAWEAIFYPALLWYILDTGVSAYLEVWFNVIINTLLLIQLMAPLLNLRGRFFHKEIPRNETP